ncbi:hypothetical protein [Kribbia dieselivorans]|uniref:hypothetical protein n=1 Tax=Kribbia dieselivorans TaxID=331526 RepID=UPI0008386FA9|nr:hypothetical protein [Kribbia dieselivorans]
MKRTAFPRGTVVDLLDSSGDGRNGSSSSTTRESGEVRFVPQLKGGAGTVGSGCRDQWLDDLIRASADCDSGRGEEISSASLLIGLQR